MEQIKANGNTYICTKIWAGIGTISFTTADDAEFLKSQFSDVKELEISDSFDDSVYGHYENLEFQSVSINADNTSTVTMRIISGMEARIRELETESSDQKRIIDMLVAYTGIEV